MERRTFLKTLPAVGLALPPALAAPGSFSFVHFTDPHLQPELQGDAGTTRCFEAINRVKSDFSLGGGDLVFDVCEATPDRSRMLWESYRRAQSLLTKPVHCVPGNHDVYGMSRKSGIADSDPMFGKKMWEDRIGRRYQSFDHKGWHFVLLDSILNDAERNYIGGLDESQFEWLKADLAKTGPTVPIVVVTHIPIVTGIGQFFGVPPTSLKSLQFEKSKPVLDLFAQYKVKAVLQGHTHVREVLDYKGCQFITSGAVSGNWWKGERAGHPEGFGVLTVKGEQISWRYETYGWVAAKNG